MLDAIRRRRSYRAFSGRSVEKKALKEILTAAMSAPTSWGLRPWEFIVVEDAETKKTLARATPYSSFAANAPLIIVICYDPAKGRRFKEDCSLCAGHIYLEAANQGLGTCFIQIADAEFSAEMKGSEGNPEEYVKKELGIPKGYRVQCVMPLGYPLEELPPHTEDAYEEKKIHYGRFKA